MMRQQILLLESNPVRLLVVFEESVLRRQFGDRSVMRGQLQKLLDLSELDHVELFEDSWAEGGGGSLSGSLRMSGRSTT